MDKLSWASDSVTARYAIIYDAAAPYEPDDLDDVPNVKPFFTSEQLKNMDPDATWRVRLISDGPEVSSAI